MDRKLERVVDCEDTSADKGPPCNRITASIPSTPAAHALTAMQGYVYAVVWPETDRGGQVRRL